MEKKRRSIGVTIYGWLFIISSVIGLLSAINPQQFIRIFGIVIFILSVAIAIAILICGIFLLKLNSTARKMVFLLCFIQIILAPIIFRPIPNSINLAYEDAYRKRKQVIAEQLKPEHQQKAIENFQKSEKMFKNVAWILVILMFGVPFVALDIIPIIFFTRPKVKRQFTGAES